jgi:putative PIN family toxin of toxin-antitoxin system
VRVVLDSNVFGSGLIGKEGSAPQLVLEALGADQIQVVVSLRLIEELEAVLARPKFASRTTRTGTR